MKNWEEVVSFLQKKDLLGKDFCFPKKEEEKETHTLVWVLAIIGAVVTIAGIAYAVYRYMTPDYLDDFDDDFEDDYEDDLFDDDETV